MDWREFMRGLFGNRPKPPSPPPAGERRADHWPPPLPIPEFHEEGDQKNDFHSERTPRGGKFFWGGRNRGHPNIGGEGGFEDIGSRFVFGDLFSAVGEMFQEMERSMRDMESFIGGIDMDGPKMIPFSGPLSPPPAIQEAPAPHEQDNSKEENVRDYVLKEPDTPKKRDDNHRNYKHYIPPPNSNNEKVDRDLDELYLNSELDLSELPVPGTTQDSRTQSLSPKSLLPFGQHGGVTSSFQKTYQTFSFKNGRWEGEIVKEDQNGKEVTRYYQDKDGQRHETTEYFPRDGSVHSSKPELMDPNTSLSSPEPPRLFQFFERFFRPRM